MARTNTRLTITSMIALLAAFPAAASEQSRAPVQRTDVIAPHESRAPEDPRLLWTPASVVLVARKLSPGVYAVLADDTETKAVYGAPVATSGAIIVGERGALVVDTMLNRRLAEQVISLVRRITNRPILYAVNTNHRPDKANGNQFFPGGVQVVQHEDTAEHIRTQFAADLQLARRAFGESSGLEELRPQGRPADIVLRDGESRAFNLGGRNAVVRHLGFGQTDGNLVVHVPDAKVLVVGNLVISGGPSVPWMMDGGIAGALTTLRRVRTEFPADTIIVPGHGAPTGMAAVDGHIQYLETLQRDIGEAKRAGLSQQQAVARVTERMRSRWGAYQAFDRIHAMNAARAYAEAA